MKMIKLTDFLTNQQIADASKLWRTNTPVAFHKEVIEQILKPNMTAINLKLGQENDPGYLAYLIEYAFMRNE